MASQVANKPEFALDIETGTPTSNPVSESQARLVEKESDAWRWLTRVDRKLLFKIGIAGLAVLVLIVIAVIALKSNACVLSPTIPARETPKLLASEPAPKILARMAGYIHVYGAGFLQLNIEKVTLDGLSSTISLQGGCVNVSVQYYTVAGRQFVIDELTWKFACVQEGRSSRAYEECKVTSPTFQHYFPLSQYYSCAARQAHQCRKPGASGHEETIAEVVIESLELELFGDEDDHRQGKFSKQPYESSCEA